MSAVASIVRYVVARLVLDEIRARRRRRRRSNVVERIEAYESHVDPSERARRL